MKSLIAALSLVFALPSLAQIEGPHGAPQAPVPGTIIAKAIQDGGILPPAAPTAVGVVVNDYGLVYSFETGGTHADTVYRLELTLSEWKLAQLKERAVALSDQELVNTEEGPGCHNVPNLRYSVYVEGQERKIWASIACQQWVRNDGKGWETHQFLSHLFYLLASGY